MHKSTKLIWLFPLAIAFLIFITYSNSFYNAFQYDDFPVIIENHALKEPDSIFKYLRNIWNIASRPVLMATFAFNYSLSGLNILNYRLLNILIHIANSIFIYIITLYILKIYKKAWDPGIQEYAMVGFFAALIFALHPIQVESVTYITGRSSSLVTLFSLGSIFSYFQFRDNGKRVVFITSLLCYAFALFVKESAFSILPILFLFNLFFPNNQTLKRRLVFLSPYLLITIIYLIARFWNQSASQYVSSPIRPFYTHLLVETQAWLHAVRVMIIPKDLSVFYDFPLPNSILEFQVLFPIAVLIGASYLLYRLTRIIYPIGFFAFWFIFGLLPTNSIIILQDVITDRWLYFPAIGYSIILALLAYWIYCNYVQNKRRAVKFIFFFLCGLLVSQYGFSAHLRNFTWRSPWTLWEDAVKKSPNHAQPHIGLAQALAGVGKYDEAINEYETALRFAPAAGEVYLNLGFIYFERGKLEKALQNFGTSLQLSPHLASKVYNNLGAVYLAQHKYEQAMEALDMSIKADPSNVSTYYNLASYFEEMNDIDNAVRNLEKLISLEPEYFKAYLSLSRLYSLKGWHAKAQDSYKRYRKGMELSQKIYWGKN